MSDAFVTQRLPFEILMSKISAEGLDGLPFQTSRDLSAGIRAQHLLLAVGRVFICIATRRDPNSSEHFPWKNQRNGDKETNEHITLLVNNSNHLAKIKALKGGNMISSIN